VAGELLRSGGARDFSRSHVEYHFEKGSLRAEFDSLGRFAGMDVQLRPDGAPN
jgi:hypothetical protein